MQGARPSPRSRVRAAFVLAIAATSPGCSSFQGTTAASFLRRAEEKDPNVRYKAYANLASPRCYNDEAQKLKAVEVLVAKLDDGKEPVASRAVICRTLGSLGRPEARDAILKATGDEDPLIRVEACRALGRVGRPEDATILARVMTVDVIEECRIAAIEALGELKSGDPRIIAYLAGAMEHDDPAVRYASHNALVATVGKDFGIRADDWQGYVRSVTGAAEPGESAAPKAEVATAPSEADPASSRPAELSPPSELPPPPDLPPL